MEPSTTEGQIRELESVRKQINLWRGGSGAVIVLTMAICLGLLYKDAMALAHDGPTQKQFVGQLQEGMDKEVVPRLKDVASRTLTEMQPVVQKEFVALNQRVPELTQASMKQVDELRTSLPQRASKTLDETFDKAFRDKEADIKKMFPDATEDQVKTLFTNLAEMTKTRSQAVGTELVAPHVAELEAIQKDMDTISGTEGSRPGDNGNDWEMGLSIFEVLRDDVKGLTLPKGQAAKMISDAAGKVSDTAKQVADTADQIGEKAKKEGNK